MNLQLCSAELSKLAKEIGFDEDCYFYCPDNRFTETCFVGNKTKNSELISFEYTLPELELLKMWFRETYNLHCMVLPYQDEDGKVQYFSVVYIYDEKDETNDSDEDWNDTYESALERSLLLACNYIKEKNGTTNSIPTNS